MSHNPAPPCPATALRGRTARWCDRAQALAADPGLTQDGAAKALDHLAGLQADLAEARLMHTRPLQAQLDLAERRYKPAEAAVTEARAALSEAFLRAKPSIGDLFGHVPHGTRADAVVLDDDAPDDPTRRLRPLSVTRALIDLEALRPYLSDEAIRIAVANHLADTGRADVKGVSYAALPAAAEAPCKIY
ncbi:hypothetical protein V8J82_11045 [Gymnodinialimonas sp. 2305UL16-5]|uniref:hypothetical protein n=1 Tax=Gymnodinialimonas mytili TaxID=3126503 RepID=UPI0030A7A533